MLTLFSYKTEESLFQTCLFKKAASKKSKSLFDTEGIKKEWQKEQEQKNYYQKLGVHFGSKNKLNLRKLSTFFRIVLLFSKVKPSL